MKQTEKFVIAFCIILLIASSSFSTLNSNNTIGPKVKNVQLGMEMNIHEFIEWLINMKKLPFTVVFNDDRNVRDRTEAFNNSISIKFNGRGDDLENFRIMQATGTFADYHKTKWELNDLLSAIELENIINTNIYPGNVVTKTSRPYDILTFDDNKKITSIKLHRSDFGNYRRDEDFLREFCTANKIPFDGRISRIWRYEKPSEGWRVTYYPAYREGILTLERIVD